MLVGLVLPIRSLTLATPLLSRASFLLPGLKEHVVRAPQTRSSVFLMSQAISIAEDSVATEKSFTGTRPGFDITETFIVSAEVPPPREVGCDEDDADLIERYPMPLKHYLWRSRPDLFTSITSAKRRVRRKEALVNGRECENDSTVVPGDVISLQTRSSPGLYPQGKAPFQLDVAYEDDDLAVVIKPPGVPVHGGSAVAGDGPLTRRSLRTALPYALKPSKAAVGVLRRPQHCHRLDAPTGGLLVVAKTELALTKISAAFSDRGITKRYRAIVLGRLEGSGAIDVPLDGKEALTLFAADEAAGMRAESLKCGPLTTVDLWPRTGRFHQLRHHLAEIGHPILGDAKHTSQEFTLLEGEGLFLWALGVSFEHPRTGEPLHVSIDEPEKFAIWRRREQARWDKFNAEEQRRKQEEQVEERKQLGLNEVPDIKGLEVVDKDGFRYYQYNWNAQEETTNQS